MERLSGWAELGNQTVNVGGQNSSNTTPTQRSFPNCNVSVFITGSNNLATIYSDNNSTPLANPFTSSNNGYWFFYAPNGRYDVTFSGNGVATPVTLGDVSLGSILSLNGQNNDSQNFATGNSGNNFAIASANGLHTFNLPTASANNNGALSSSDWGNFNGKQSPLTFNAPLVNNNGNVSVTLPITVAQGGTGANNATAGFDALSPANTLGDLIVGNNTGINARFPVGNNGLVLTADGSNANSGMKWALPNLNNVNGILPIANGGTAHNTAGSAFDALSPTTTLGDLIVYGNNGNANTNIRIGVGSPGQFPMANNANNTTGITWSAVGLNTNSVSGILPISAGGTGANNNIAGFDGLSPANSLGDIITANNNGINVRLPAGSNGQVLSANSANTSGLVWINPTPLTTKFTIAFNNNAFIPNSLTADITLFTLGQFQKFMSATVKHSVIFTNNNNSITDVGIAIQQAGNANFYTANFSIGNATPVSNTAFQDTVVYKSGNMGAGGQAVTAHFIATGANFGNGVATALISGSVDIWVSTIQLQ
jgi:hypothetical protein